MIQDVVCLHSNLNQAGFQTGNLEPLLRRKVGIEIAGSGELVSRLPAKAGGIGEIWTACGGRAAEAGNGRRRLVDAAVVRNRRVDNLCQNFAAVIRLEIAGNTFRQIR